MCYTRANACISCVCVCGSMRVLQAPTRRDDSQQPASREFNKLTTYAMTTTTATFRWSSFHPARVAHTSSPVVFAQNAHVDRPHPVECDVDVGLTLTRYFRENRCTAEAINAPAQAKSHRPLRRSTHTYLLNELRYRTSAHMRWNNDRHVRRRAQ